MQVTPVKSLADQKAFLRFPYDLFRQDPGWIPPLWSAEQKALDPAQNPSVEHSEVQRWLARREGQVVGRIQVIINAYETERLGEAHARFNKLDLIEDFAVAEALLHTAEQWATEQGAVWLKGPHGYTNLDESGMLVEGFETPTTFATLYNPAYYPQFLERLGYEKHVDWIERRFDLPRELPDKVTRITTLLQQRYGLRTLPLRTRRDLLSVAPRLMDLFLDSYADLEGFVPLSQAEIDLYIERYIAFLRPDFARVVVDAQGEMVGFGLTMPDLGQAMRKAGGKLWPLGWYHLLQATRRNPIANLILIGVVPQWRNKGVHGLIFREVYQSFRKVGIERIHVHPMMENNTPVHALFQDYGAQPFRRRRVYQKLLGAK